jgi:CHAT domain-containing protein
MNCRLRGSLVGLLLLTGCAQKASTPDGAFLLDEDIDLARGAQVDSAQRRVVVDGDSVVVAVVDEKLTDISVRLSVESTHKNAAKPVEVENHFGGAGIEVAALEVRGDTRITLTLTGPQNMNAPGRVHVHLRRYDVTSKTSRFSAEREGFRAWSSATNSGFRIDAVKKSALADMDLAIASLESAQGDASLAAYARLIKANMLNYFRVDWRESRAEAQRAAKAFAALPKPAPLEIARARFVEAVALGEIGRNRASVNPTSEEATSQARQWLAELGGDASTFGPIERARAIDAIGYIDINESKLEDAQKQYEEAKALYQAAGHAAGEFEMTANLALVLAEGGRRTEASKAYEPVLANLDRIADPYKRVVVLVAAAGAQAFSGFTDQAAENLHRAIAEAREYQLRSQEAEALQTLAYHYWFRGDYLQAKAFASEALRIAREEQDAMGLVYALQTTGLMARLDGDVATAIEMHKEAISLSSHMVFRMRTMRLLALDYLAIDKPAEALVQLRASLAVDLQDPDHYAYADVKRDLAELLIEHGGSGATLKEAAALLASTLPQTIKVQDKSGEIGARRVLAMLLTKQGKFDAARAEYQRAFALIFEFRGMTANPQFRMATLLHEQAAFRGYFDLVMRNAVARGSTVPRPASPAEESALRTLELARESHFGAGRPIRMNAATSARIDALFSRMAEKSLRISALLNRKLDAEETAQLASLQLDMSSLRAELDRERTAAADKQSGEGSSGSHATRAWRAIAPGAVQLSYALGSEHAYVWARSAKETRVAVLSEKPEALERELTGLAELNPQATPAKIEQALAHVSSVLLPTGLLPDDSSVVQIVAEGRIASVPFAGLRSPVDASRRLVETHAVTMITSLLEVEDAPRPKQSRPFRLVALASGSGTLRAAAVVDPAPRLQAATTEIREVANLFEARDTSAKVKLLTGQEGDALALRGIWSSGADVVHFATHALADLRQPLASLLVLPANDATGTPTYLTAGQVQEWRGDADLVFLSACESAIGPPRFAGGMPGLQSAFLRAGARGVIATLWPIEDVLAREFSANFYQRFTAGQTAAQALSETQRAWLAPKAGAGEAEQLRRRITALAHGFYTQ